jgi:hypothetical protein
VKRSGHRVSWLGIFLLCLWVSNAASLYADQEAAGRSIGKVSTNGDLIVIELDRAALGQPNLFDLVGRTLRFSPAGSGYRVRNEALRWDAEYGAELTLSDVTLQRFEFPFSGQRWSSFSVGTAGSIRFGPPPKEGDLDAYGRPDGGIAAAIGRFDRLAEVGERLGARAPAIGVFLKPRMTGPRYVRELADRVVITWELTEPFGGLLDFSWYPTTNLFQAILHRDGSVEMSYKSMAAKDGIVGIYPILPKGESVRSVNLSDVTAKSDRSFRRLGTSSIFSPTTRISASTARRPAARATGRSAARSPGSAILGRIKRKKSSTAAARAGDFSSAFISRFSSVRTKRRRARPAMRPPAKRATSRLIRAGSRRRRPRGSRFRTTTRSAISATRSDTAGRRTPPPA